MNEYIFECSSHVDNRMEQSAVCTFNHPRLALTWHCQSLQGWFVEGATCLYTRKCTPTILKAYHKTRRGNSTKEIQMEFNKWNSTNGETCQTGVTNIRIMRTVCSVGTAQFLKSNVSWGDHYFCWIVVQFALCVTAWCDSHPCAEAMSRGVAWQSWLKCYRLPWILMHVHTYAVTQSP